MKNILLCVLLIVSIGTFAQNQPSFFKVYPVLDGTEPNWVTEMYDLDANVMEVIDAYHSFYSENSFEKNMSIDHLNSGNSFKRALIDWQMH